MSIRIMSDIWEMSFPPTDKLVFLALADCANDEGLAWPSIATIARKSGVSERTVQRSIRVGELAGLIRREEVKGKGCKYHFNPRHSVTPDKVSRVTNEAHTPDTVSPKPSRTINVDKAKALPTKRASAPAMPEGVELNVWNDFLELRKAKRAPLSNTALAAIEREAALVGWSLNSALAESVARGWQGFKANWVEDRRNGNTRQSDSMGRTERAAIQALRELGGTARPAMRTGGGHALARQEPNALLAIRHERGGSD